MKQCSKCENWLPEASYHKTTGGRLRADCRRCRNAVTAAWRERMPALSAETQRRYHLLKNYGMTQTDYDSILSRQGGVCAICKTIPTVRYFDVDHDHNCCPRSGSCGRCIRGLLCCKCNKGIGQLNDDPDLLESALRYLTRPSNA